MSSGQAPVTLLNGVTSVGPGASHDMAISRDAFTGVARATGYGVSGAASVALEGSHDQVHWSLIFTNSVSNTIMAQTARDSNFFRYIRGNVTSLDPGGTVTLTVVSA